MTGAFQQTLPEAPTDSARDFVPLTRFANEVRHLQAGSACRRRRGKKEKRDEDEKGTKTKKGRRGKGTKSPLAGKRENMYNKPERE